MKNLSGQNISFTDFKLNGFYSLEEWRPFLFIPFFIMFMLSIFANSILIYFIISQRSLHSPMYVLIGILAVGDFILPILFLPHMLLSFLFNWNGISLTGCLIQMFGLHFFGALHSTVLLWMAIDRYFAICRPLYYHKYMELSNFLKFVVFPVIRNAAFVMSVVILAGKLSFCETNVIDHCFCEHMALVQLACGDISINNLVGLLTVFLVPSADVLIIIASYVVIFISVFKSGKGHMKAINTCITHLIVISVTLILAMTSFLSYRTRNNFSSDSHVFISTMYILFPSCFNPIIYGVRTTEIRQTFLKFINNVKVFPKSKENMDVALNIMH